MEGVRGTEEAGTYSFHPRDTMDILAVVDVGQGIMSYMQEYRVALRRKTRGNSHS